MLLANSVSTSRGGRMHQIESISRLQIQAGRLNLAMCHLKMSQWIEARGVCDKVGAFSLPYFGVKEERSGAKMKMSDDWDILNRWEAAMQQRKKWHYRGEYKTENESWNCFKHAHSQAIEENENVAKAWFRRGPNLTVLKMGHLWMVSD